jgi:tetratricopeptide (TPR) repeat protein
MSTSDDPTPDLRSLLQQAHALIDRRRFPQARQLLATGIQHNPDNTQLLYLCAFVDYSTGQTPAADETLDRVLANEPKHYGARTLRGEIYESLKRYPDAEAVWIDLLRDYPEDPDCYAHYADLMLRTLHLEKAERLTREGLRLDPAHWQCLYAAYLIDVIQGRTGSGNNEHLHQLLRDHPERVHSLLALVIALNERGDSKGALRVAQQLVATRPDSEQFVNLVRILKRQSHWSLLPLYPMRRWGWSGAAVVTAIGIIGVRLAGHTLPPAIALTIAYVWLGYVVYSWVWPRILQKLI